MDVALYPKDCSEPLAAATSHQASSAMPKYKAPPVIRWRIDITIVMIGRKICKCGERGRSASVLTSAMAIRFGRPGDLTESPAGVAYASKVL